MPPVGGGHGQAGAGLLSLWALVVVRGTASFIASWRAAAKRLLCLHVSVKYATTSGFQKFIATANQVLIVKRC